MLPRPAFLLSLAALVVAGDARADASGYFRWPAERQGTLVFTSEGDLWTAALAGGTARRLTSHPAEETQAALSADGSLVAFVATYDGGPDVYVMPLAGGEPTRLTWDAGRVWISGFDAAGWLVYATESVAGPSGRRVLRAVDPRTGQTRELPLADAYDATFDADGKTLWFTRFGTAVTGDNVRGYRGGAMAELWRWSGNAEATRVAADWSANLTRPMAWRGKLYVVSDADGVANLWSMTPDGRERVQLTRHQDFDVRGARLGDGVIVYQHGADLRAFELSSGLDRAVPLALVSDLEQRRERFLRKPLGFVSSVTFGLGGDRVAVTARGQVAVAGLGPLRRVELMVPSGARLRSAVLSLDGKDVFAIVDHGATSEVWRFPSDGSPGGQALTQNGVGHRWRLTPSPDGKWLAHDDERAQLWVTRLSDGNTRLVDVSTLDRNDQYRSLAWSADGKWLAFARPDSPRLLAQLVLAEVEGTRKVVLTTDRYESYAPAFSRDGRWLYFLSDRTFQATPPSPWGDRNTGPFFDRRTKVYALSLQRGTRFPFQPKDELLAPKPAASEAKKDAKKEEKKDEKKDPVPAIELDGLAARLFEVPAGAGNYGSLALDADRLYLLDRDAAPKSKPALKTLSLSADAPQLEVFAPDVDAFALSADAKKLALVRPPGDGGTLGDVLIVDAGAKLPADVSKAQVRLQDWTLAVEPTVEWRQMFDDAWRMHRQFSFDPGMRGQDWDAVRRRYAPLLPRVNDRAELDDLLAQMIAEHGLLHSQVRGGELRADPESVSSAGLGALFEETAQGVVYARSYRTEAEIPSDRAPLDQPGVDARPGDLVLSIDGRPVRRSSDVPRLIRQRVGQQVLLRLKRGSATAHDTIVTPVAMDREATLRYGDWVQASRARVEQASGGRFGYLHLRAMGAGDVATFVREFYAQHDRVGLIIDVRRNRGGNIDSWVIEKLLRRAWAFWQPPDSAPYWNMQQAFRGHLVVLADQLTYSDGETFTAGVKALELGPVVGMKTAGAGVWLSDRSRLADNGSARIAESPQFDARGRWLIEGRGVAPDVPVDNLPWATARGEDAQLDAALGILAKRASEAPLYQPPPQKLPPRGTPAHDGSR